MKTAKTHLIVLALCALGLFLAAPAIVRADTIGTITASATAPTVDGADIANLGTPTSLDDTNGVIWYDTAVRGQTFTTGSNAAGYDLDAITVRSYSSQWGVNLGHDPVGFGPFSVQVGTISGTTLTQLLR